MSITQAEYKTSRSVSSPISVVICCRDFSTAAFTVSTSSSPCALITVQPLFLISSLLYHPGQPLVIDVSWHELPLFLAIELCFSSEADKWMNIMPSTLMCDVFNGRPFLVTVKDIECAGAIMPDSKIGIQLCNSSIAVSAGFQDIRWRSEPPLRAWHPVSGAESRITFPAWSRIALAICGLIGLSEDISGFKQKRTEFITHDFLQR